MADFYGPAVDRSRTYDRATGFFRSSFYDLTRVQVAAFALRGGRLRLVCSPDLERSDIDAIERGADAAAAADEALRRELGRILEHPHSSSGAEILAALLAEGALEVRLALRSGRGMFHDKFGVFGDALGNRVSFAGSINETWNAWHPLGNHESFEVFTSWSGETQRPGDHAELFDQLWSSRLQGVTVVEPSRQALAALRDRVEEGADKILKKVVERATNGRRHSLLDHQRAAIGAWQRGGHRGIFKHATGSGKTITALDAIRDHIRTGRPALVIVPSRLLLSQWDDESQSELSDLAPAVLLAGGGAGDWRRLLRAYTSPEGDPRLTIATVDTASSEDFLRRVQAGRHLLIVADEVHRMGAPKAQRILSLEAGATLGLSATPERAGDPDGTSRILNYFGPIVRPEFTLADAIAAGRLCKYEYHVHLVHLDEDERDRWEAMSKGIRELAARQSVARREGSGDFSRLDPRLKMLLIQRARIARAAASKAPLAADIVHAKARPGEHWLVYCDHIAQLEDVRRELAARGVSSMPYYSSMPSDRAATLDRFTRDGGVLVSIKCLDEGVDIPAVSHALVAASSRNPREFIQRRGRVLRVHAGKTFAVVHDLIVQPPDPGSDDFRSLVLGELARAHEFSTHAVNPSAALKIRALAVDWDIDPDTLLGAGFEDDDDPSDHA